MFLTYVKMRPHSSEANAITTASRLPQTKIIPFDRMGSEIAGSNAEYWQAGACINHSFLTARTCGFVIRNPYGDCSRRCRLTRSRPSSTMPRPIRQMRARLFRHYHSPRGRKIKHLTVPTNSSIARQRRPAFENSSRRLALSR